MLCHGQKIYAETCAFGSSLPHPHKVIIGGNHDFALDSQTGWYQSAGAAIHSKFGYPVSDVQRVREHMQRVHRHNSGILHYLEGSSVALKVNRPEVQHKSWKVYGSPWTPKFGGWAWNYERGHSARCEFRQRMTLRTGIDMAFLQTAIYKDIPSDVDVLLTHGPPHRLGGLDKIHDGTHVGCEELARKAIEEEIRPHLWATGHIHEARGVHWQTWGTNEPPAAVTGQHYKRSRSLLINAAMVDFDESKWRAEKRRECTRTPCPANDAEDCRSI